MTRRICVITGSRAEYGLLRWVLEELRATPAAELQLIVTGMHLAPEFGHTVDDIRRDGIEITRAVPMLVAGDTAASATRSIGLGVIGFSDAFEALLPDIVVVLGDRFEILAAATAAMMHNLPIAHIAGGDTTEGAVDESIRHAITKMAHIHLVTNDVSARRVLQMGESPEHIHVVGSPGLDLLRRRKLLTRQELEASLGAPFGARNLLVTFHPVTLEPGDGARQFGELLAALDGQDADTRIWFTGANADPGHRPITQALDSWIARNGHRAKAFTSLGQLRYLSLMALSDAVVGNSSSGLYEAPSLKVPTIDIGDRQAGRLAAASVIRCEPQRDAIRAALSRGLQLDCRNVINPYGDGDSSQRIVKILLECGDPKSLLKKHFHDVRQESALD